jgi:hypothetical protein
MRLALVSACFVAAAAEGCVPCVPLCPAFAQVGFNNGSNGVVVTAPPYPDFAFLPTAGFNRYSNFSGSSIVPGSDGLTFWADGTYEVKFQAVLFNTRNCQVVSDVSCTQSCASVCATVCSCTVGEECDVACDTACMPACNSTCSSAAWLDCPTPMFTVFAVLDREFSATDLDLTGDFNTVSPGGVLTFKSSGPMKASKGQTLTLVIANGSGPDPVDIKLMAWSVYATPVY